MQRSNRGTDRAKRNGELGRLVGYQLHLCDLIALEDARSALAARQTTPATVTAMFFIRDQPGCDQTTVGRLLSINRSSAMKLIDRLESRGFVERSEGRDRRSNGLYLTAAGSRFLSEVVVLLRRSDAALCATLDSSERAELLRLLKKILAGAELKKQKSSAA
jgi:DNA-binding MarR family transcriptional regulator